MLTGQPYLMWLRRVIETYDWSTVRSGLGPTVRLGASVWRLEKAVGVQEAVQMADARATPRKSRAATGW